MSVLIRILQESFEKIKPQSDQFAASFYENLLQSHPEMKPLFTHADMGEQKRKLLNGLVLVVTNIPNPEALEPILNDFRSKHLNDGFIAEYYEPIGEALLLTLEQYLQADWSPEVKQAWLDAFTTITTLMLKGAGVDYVPTKDQQEIAVNSVEPVIQQSTIATFVLKVVDYVPKKNQEQIAVNSEKSTVINPKIEEIPEVKLTNQISTEIGEASSELAVEILVSSFEKVKPHADEFAASFYENLFQIHPEVKPLFTTADMKNQEKKLLNSLVLVVENLRNPEALEPVLKALGGRHIGYGVTAKYYRPVGEALLMTLEQYLQADWTPEVKKAWLSAYREITALMLKGAKEASSAKVVKTDKHNIYAEAVRAKRKTKNLAKDSVLETKIPGESNSNLFKEIIDNFTANYQQLRTNTSKQSFIDNFIANYQQLRTKILEQQFIDNFIGNYQQLRTNISEQPLSQFLKEVPPKLTDAFWTAPTWSVAIIAAVLFTMIIVTVDDDSFLGKVFGAADTISLVVALVLFIKETPDRRKQFHYQAWSTIDAAQGAKVSNARILALQDLNEDSVSLRGLDAPGAELVEINLSHADISKANLVASDLSNANLSYANLDNASLSQAKFTSANLSYAQLGFASLIQANLCSANLDHANLICANLSYANLSGADLRGASLSGANLEGAYLTGANLKNAQVSDYELSSAFLEGAIMPDGSKYKSSESDR